MCLKDAVVFSEHSWITLYLLHVYTWEITNWCIFRWQISHLEDLEIQWWKTPTIMCAVNANDTRYSQSLVDEVSLSTSCFSTYVLWTRWTSSPRSYRYTKLELTLMCHLRSEIHLNSRKSIFKCKFRKKCK